MKGNKKTFTPSKAPLAMNAAATTVVLGTAMNIAVARTTPMTEIDRTAPIISRGDIFIKAPIETVWHIQTNISGWTTWRPTVSAAHYDGQLKAGSAFPWEEGGLQITSTVQDLVPMRRIVWTGPAQGIHAIHVWEFTATAEGVQVHTEESWTGEAAKAHAATLQPLLDKALQDWLARLKSTSEASASNTAR